MRQGEYDEGGIEVATRIDLDVEVVEGSDAKEGRTA